MRRRASSRGGFTASILLGWFGAIGVVAAQEPPTAREFSASQKPRTAAPEPVSPVPAVAPDDGAPPATVPAPPDAGSDGAARGDGDDQEGDFLAFLEYLGSWEDSDAEWKQFHPEEGLVGVGSAPDNATQDPVREEVDWRHDDGRS